MPQMAPLSWLILFVMFSATLVTFNMLNYYSFTPLPPKTQQLNSSLAKPMNWKW